MSRKKEGALAGLGKVAAGFSERFFPNPFVFAIVLTVVAFLLALTFTDQTFGGLVICWCQGFWELLTFAMQMTLLLVLCDSVARTSPVLKTLRTLCSFARKPRQIIFITTFLACVLGLISWGLGLVGGAILAREFGRSARLRSIKVHYPLVVASAYLSLMIWHCGFSGSIPLFIATPGHIFEDVMGVIPFSETVGSMCNIGIAIGLLTVLPFVMAFMHPKGTEIKEVPQNVLKSVEEEWGYLTQGRAQGPLTWGEKMEHSRILGGVVTCLCLGATVWWFFVKGGGINLNSLNMFWFFLASLLHKTPIRLVRSFEVAVKSTAGIILQFPFYAGIMGVVKFSGLAIVVSHWFTTIANSYTWPTLGLIYSGVMNIFIPSGGGKWVVDAPIIIPTSQALGVSMQKTALIDMMGDQLTNMVQPFWALPLLGIANLEAKEIIGYTAVAMIFGFFIMALGLTFLPAG